MKASRLILLMLILSLVLCSCGEITGDDPPADTDTEGVPTQTAWGVSLSHAPGFYAGPFELTMSSQGGTVYYTTDGTVPTEESAKYEAPIQIADATKNANVWSMRTDTSTGFMTERIANLRASGPINYKAPDFKVDKCTVIRAVAIDKYGNRSPETVASYFVGFENKTGYDDINIVSLVTDPDNLFDYEDGIYVLGKTYDDYVKDYDRGRREWTDSYWWWWPANYRGKGMEWERPVHFEYFDTEKNFQLSKDIGMRTQGGGSRGKIPRSLNLYARKQYDKTSRFGYDFFGTGYDPQRVTLFTGGDDKYTMLRDKIVNDLASDMRFCTMDYVPCAVFLDGEYWGFYWIAEKYDPEYLEFHYNVNKDDVIIIKNGAVEEGPENAEDIFQEMNHFIRHSDLRDEENAKKIEEMIDVESYLQYYAVEIYCGRDNDWPSSNYALWRTVNDDGSEYGDGRWRWMIFDMNSGGMSSKQSTDNTFEFVRERDLGFDGMMQNEKYLERFKEILLGLQIGEFSAQNVRKHLSADKALISAPMKKNFERFYGKINDEMNRFEKEIDDIMKLFGIRGEYLRVVMEDYR